MLYPKVSCICPTRGRFETLRQAIAFFLLQDYPNKELIIFNNHPVPITPHPKLAKHNVKVVNAGDYSGRSMEIVYAHTLHHVSLDAEYISVWDDDDMYFPWHLSDNIKKLQESGKKAIRAKYGYWYDINHSMGDKVTIVSNTLEASMIAKKDAIFFEEDNNKDASNPSYTHPHIHWESKLSKEDEFCYNYDITANFRWGYGKHYAHLQSVGPHRNNLELGEDQFLRPIDVKDIFYDLINAAYLTTEREEIVSFTNETKSKFFQRIISHRIDRFGHVDRFKVWLYWNDENPPGFVKLCHKSIIENTFCDVVVINDNTINTYSLPQNVMMMHPVQRSDYLRVHLLYYYGGFWFDSDTYVVGDLDEYYFSHLIHHETVFPWEYNVKGVMTTPIFSSKPYGLIIREAYNNIQNYLSTNPNIGWSGIGQNGILKAVSTLKHRGEGYYFGLYDVAVYGYNNGEINKWNFDRIVKDKLHMIIFHWSQIGAEMSHKIGVSENDTLSEVIQKIISHYPNMEELLKKSI
jgi:hypothetical protein